MAQKLAGIPWQIHANRLVSLSFQNALHVFGRKSFSATASISDKVLIQDVLESTATRRDVRSYLSKFREKSDRKPSKSGADPPSTSPQVNLGQLYPDAEAKDRSALFEPESSRNAEQYQILHTAIVRLRAPQRISDEVLASIGRTVSQLTALGMQSIVIVDPGVKYPVQHASVTGTINHHITRVVDALHLSGDDGNGERPRAQRLDQAFEVQVDGGHVRSASSTKVREYVSVANAELIYSCLRRGVIPVISPIGLHCDSLRAVFVQTNEGITGLVRKIHGVIVQQRFRPDNLDKDSAQARDLPIVISIDRIIILDPSGGIPSAERSHAPHVYINMKQEYRDIQAQLKNYPPGLLEDEVVHTENLDLLRNTLELLPDSSSGLIVTPEEVARSRREPSREESGPRVRTRSKRNPLIHNLLTDKPAISSSLPYGRSSGLGYGGPTSTFVKRGMQLTTIPDVFVQPWSFPSISKPAESISDPRINMARLVELIQASFGKQLDVDRYLARIQDCFAGLVVAGDYEGCALFTWETSPTAPGVKIPYLDKFAVLPQSQGTGASVADILFTCMIMDCFPNGVCWRSRSTNPVNKWYFERAKGAWKIPKTLWTSFWTTDQPTREELMAYETICRDVPPTWPSSITG